MLEPYWLATYQPRITLTTRTTRALTGKTTSPLVARLATTYVEAGVQPFSPRPPPRASPSLPR